MGIYVKTFVSKYINASYKMTMPFDYREYLVVCLDNYLSAHSVYDEII